MIYDTLLSRIQLRKRMADTTHFEIVFSPEVRLSHLNFCPV